MFRITDADGNFWFTTAKAGSGIFQWFFGVQKLVDTRPGDQSPVFGFWAYNTTSRGAGQLDSTPGYASWMADTQGGSRVRYVRGRKFDDSGEYGIVASTGIFPMTFCPNASASTFWHVDSSTSNYVDGKHDAIQPVSLMAIDAGNIGYRGKVPDIAFVASSSAVGASEPSSAAQERMLVGNTLIPSSVVPIL